MTTTTNTGMLTRDEYDNLFVARGVTPRFDYDTYSGNPPAPLQSDASVDWSTVGLAQQEVAQVEQIPTQFRWNSDISPTQNMQEYAGYLDELHNVNTAQSGIGPAYPLLGQHSAAYRQVADTYGLQGVNQNMYDATAAVAEDQANRARNATGIGGILEAALPVAMFFIPGIGPVAAGALAGGTRAVVQGGDLGDVIKSAIAGAALSYGANQLSNVLFGGPTTITDAQIAELANMPSVDVEAVMRAWTESGALTPEQLSWANDVISDVAANGPLISESGMQTLTAAGADTSGLNLNLDHVNIPGGFNAGVSGLPAGGVPQWVTDAFSGAGYSANDIAQMYTNASSGAVEEIARNLAGNNTGIMNQLFDRNNDGTIDWNDARTAMDTNNDGTINAGEVINAVGTVGATVSAVGGTLTDLGVIGGDGDAAGGTTAGGATGGTMYTGPFAQSGIQAVSPAQPRSVDELYMQILGRAPESQAVRDVWSQQFGPVIDPSEVAQFVAAAVPETSRTGIMPFYGGPEQTYFTGNRATNFTGQGVYTPPATVAGGGGAPDYTGINSLYQSILGRPPESQAAVDAWYALFGDTIEPSELAVFQQAAAPEITNRGVTTIAGGAGNDTVTGGGGATTLTGGSGGIMTTPAYTPPTDPNQWTVSDLYRVNLGRDPESQAAVDAWAQQFGPTIDAAERQQFAVASIPEYQQSGLTGIPVYTPAPSAPVYTPTYAQQTAAPAPPTTVSGLYQSILGRAPESQAVIDAWTQQFGDTIDPSELVTFQQAAAPELATRGMAGGGQVERASGLTAMMPHLIQGEGDGLSDDVPAYIDGGGMENHEPIRVTDGEYIIPSDAVSGIGNGSTDAGARALDAMVARIRKERTGSKQPARKIHAQKIMQSV